MFNEVKLVKADITGSVYSMPLTLYCDLLREVKTNLGLFEHDVLVTNIDMPDVLFKLGDRWLSVRLSKNLRYYLKVWSGTEVDSFGIKA